MEAINNSKALKSSSTIPMMSEIPQAAGNEVIAQPPRSIVIGRHGNDSCLLKAENISYFFVQSKIIFGVDENNKKYRIESQNLSILFEILDKKIFFKVNRKYILNCKFIQKFKKLDRVKTLIEMSVPVPEKIIVSQGGSIRFRNWIHNL